MATNCKQFLSLKYELPAQCLPPSHISLKLCQSHFHSSQSGQFSRSKTHFGTSKTVRKYFLPFGSMLCYTQEKRYSYVPHICQFWDTTSLIRLAKGAPKIAQIRDKIAKNGQKGLRFSVFYAKHRKNCECCPGHYLIVIHYSSI